jgi:hypothetical protein
VYANVSTGKKKGKNTWQNGSEEADRVRQCVTDAEEEIGAECHIRGVESLVPNFKSQCLVYLLCIERRRASHSWSREPCTKC